MATVLASTALVGLAQLMGIAAQHRRLGTQQSVALREAGNLMETLAASPWDELEESSLSSLGLSEECRRGLPDARLQIHVTAEDENTKRVAVQIDWRTVAGRRVAPVRLVAWRFRHEESTP